MLQYDLGVGHCGAVQILQQIVLHWHMLEIQLSPSLHQVMNAKDNFPVHRYPCRLGLEEPKYGQDWQCKRCIVRGSSKSNCVGW